MPLQATSGAASYDAFGGGVPAVTNYIEDVFSTYLYAGNNSTQTIVNGIDLSGKGGLIWFKSRTTVDFGHGLFDTTRGRTKVLHTEQTVAQETYPNAISSFNNNGVSLGDASYNFGSQNYASWTFRKQPKFFDVVTFVAGSSTNRTISHSLGSTPAFYVMKDVSGVSQWPAYHTSLGANQYVALNKTDATTTSTGVWGTGPTSTTFSVDESGLCTSGNTYVVYLFASNAGGFGLTGTDNVISCGSYTTDSSGNATVNLGYEPQWFLRKKTNGTDNWRIADNMRGWTTLGVSGDGSGNQQVLFPNLSNAEATASTVEGITSTGFGCLGLGTGNETFIYIAIRRGPMKVPTTGTSVFNPVTYTAAASTSYSTGLSYIDLMIEKRRDSAQVGFFYDRLRGNANRLVPSSTSSEITDANSWSNQFANQGTVTTASSLGSEWQGSQVIWNMRRAPSFMDVVCYSGTSAARTINHNLGVVPELIIEKCRNTSSAQGWQVYAASQGASNTAKVNSTIAFGADGNFGTAPTSTVFSINGADHPSGETYVAYLFSTCAGVSKVGLYTGTGATQTIDCGFTGGARFVLVKRANSTGAWYVFDTARGMVSGTDPFLALNSAAAESNANNLYTTTGGFQVVSTTAGFNESGSTYIFLAIA